VEISRLNDTTILLARIDPFLADFLRQLNVCADPGDNEAARARLFSPPTEDPLETGLTEDWQDFVEPELAKLFQSALDVVAGDLKKMHLDTKTGEGTLSIPYEHLERWIHGLNQARLVMTERHQIREDELDREPSLAKEPRALLILQMHFYANLQHLFLRLLEDR